MWFYRGLEATHFIGEILKGIKKRWNMPAHQLLNTGGVILMYENLLLACVAS